MPPSRNDVISGSTPARICSLKLVAINFCRSGQSNPRFASNLRGLRAGPEEMHLESSMSREQRVPDQAHRPGRSFAFIRPLRYLKVQNSPCPLRDHGRRVDLHIARISKKIRDRDGEIKLMARRKKRRRLVAVAAHCAQPVEQQFKKPVTIEGGSNQRERKNIDRFFDSRSTAGPRRRKRNNVQRTGRRNHLLHGRARCDERASEERLLHPATIAQVIDGEIVRECARQNNAADAAGRGACYAVDDDPQAKGPPYRLQECK